MIKRYHRNLEEEEEEEKKEARPGNIDQWEESSRESRCKKKNKKTRRGGDIMSWLEEVVTTCIKKNKHCIHILGRMDWLSIRNQS